MDEKDEKGLAIQIPCLISLAALNRMFWRKKICADFESCFAQHGLVVQRIGQNHKGERRYYAARGGGNQAQNDPTVKWGWNLKAQVCQEDILSYQLQICSSRLSKKKMKWYYCSKQPFKCSHIKFWEICNAPKVTITVMTFWFEADLRLWEFGGLFLRSLQKFGILCTFRRGL